MIIPSIIGGVLLIAAIALVLVLVLAKKRRRELPVVRKQLRRQNRV